MTEWSRQERTFDLNLFISVKYKVLGPLLPCGSENKYIYMEIAVDSERAYKHIWELTLMERSLSNDLKAVARMTSFCEKHTACCSAWLGIIIIINRVWCMWWWSTITTWPWIATIKNSNQPWPFVVIWEKQNFKLWVEWLLNTTFLQASVYKFRNLIFAHAHWVFLGTLILFSIMCTISSIIVEYKKSRWPGAKGTIKKQRQIQENFNSQYRLVLMHSH